MAERIVRTYALEMERFERDEEKYRLAVERIQQVYCPPVAESDLDLNRLSVRRFEWAAKLLFRMLRNLPCFRFAKRFLNEFDMQGWNQEFCDVFWDRFHDDYMELTTERCMQMDRVIGYWRQLNTARHARFNWAAGFTQCPYPAL